VSFNPYSPPAVKVDGALQPDAPPRKPWAVTILQVVSAIFLVLVAVGIYRSVTALMEWRAAGVNVTQVLLGFAWRAAIPLLLFVMLYQLPKRTQTGRWLGILLIAGFIAIPIYLFFFPAKPIGTSISNTLGAAIGCLMLIAPFTWWLYAFGFSRKARAYFRSSARK